MKSRVSQAKSMSSANPKILPENSIKGKKSREMRNKGNQQPQEQEPPPEASLQEGSTETGRSLDLFIRTPRVDGIGVNRTHSGESQMNDDATAGNELPTLSLPIDLPNAISGEIKILFFTTHLVLLIYLSLFM